MLSRAAAPRAFPSHVYRSCSQKIFLGRRALTTDHRTRLSNFFVPTGGIAKVPDGQVEDVHSMLVRAGYVRQAYAGIFHYLPLGLRVHEKLERLIDKHMKSLGASKLALSTISSEALWKKSDRLEKGGAELFRFKDRKGSKMILSPTHEEEITTLVSLLVTSYKQLPLRLYQISRKYRDERRPRAGLLRGKEFTMKDLYTFDASEQGAIETYEDVQAAYRNLFDELQLPYLVAEADSGNMGGTLSHEYHYASPNGEDRVITCTHCKYTSNEEAAQSRPPEFPTSLPDPTEISVYHGVTRDRKTLINAFFPKHSTDLDSKTPIPNEINIHRVRAILPEIDPSVGNPLELFQENFTEFRAGEEVPMEAGSFSQVVNLFDSRLPREFTETSFSNHTDQPLAREFITDKRIPTTMITRDTDEKFLDLLKLREGDGCPRCDGRLRVTDAIELGHTFHLGTRYTVPLKGVVAGEDGEKKHMIMGCHGIGVSRMIPALADGFRDAVGLGWPRVVAPFEVVVVGRKGAEGGAEEVYDLLAGRELESGGEVDAILDDRARDLPWKLKDADLIGYPVVVVLGRGWKDGKVEVQARRKGVKLEVGLGELRTAIRELLKEL
ncbi:hypothetical protein RUND412_010482 [Rhizina undulata]